MPAEGYQSERLMYRTSQVVSHNVLVKTSQQTRSFVNELNILLSRSRCVPLLHRDKVPCLFIKHSHALAASLQDVPVALGWGLGEGSNTIVY